MKKSNLPFKRVKMLGNSFEYVPFSEEHSHLVAPAKFGSAGLTNNNRDHITLII
jgi:hypothetical protein